MWCISFLGGYTTAILVLNFWKKKIVNNFLHNLCLFLFLTPDDIVLPEWPDLSVDRYFKKPVSVEQIIAFGHTESSSDIAKALLNDLSKKGNRIPQHLMNKT